MEFKIGDRVLTPDERIVEIIRSEGDNFFLIKDGLGNVTSRHKSDLTHLDELDIAPRNRKKTKMDSALRETLSDITENLDDESWYLTESIIKYDYNEKIKKHYITLDIVLKENEE